VADDDHSARFESVQYGHLPYGSAEAASRLTTLTTAPRAVATRPVKWRNRRTPGFRVQNIEAHFPEALNLQ